MTYTTYTPAAGDIIEVNGHRVGEAKRVAEILEVHGGNGTSRHFHVRWEDGHESLYFPGSDAIIKPHHVAQHDNTGIWRR